MIKRILLFSFCFGIINLVLAQDEEDEKALESLIQDTFDHVWSELNEENIAKYHTEDFLLLEHGEVWNNDTISHYFEKALQQEDQAKRTNDFEFISIKIEGDMAWIAYWNNARFEYQEKPARLARWLESATATKTGEGWKLEMLHSTRVPLD